MKLPAGAGAARAAARKAPKGFMRLQGAETIPVGATLDTAHGRVKVRSAADTKAKKLQSGQFFRGRFSIRQSRIKKRSKKLITELRLTGSSFKKACKAKASISAKKKKRSKKRVRRLFGNAKGSFRTSGRNAAATVRGTRWSVQDRCDGTLVTVQRGRVEVRDKVKRKTVIVRTGPQVPRQSPLTPAAIDCAADGQGRQAREGGPEGPRALAVPHRAGAGRRRLHRRRL